MSPWWWAGIGLVVGGWGVLVVGVLRFMRLIAECDRTMREAFEEHERGRDDEH